MNDLIDELGLRPFKDKFHDFTLPWINRNAPGCINQAIRVPEFRLLSKLIYWKKNIFGGGLPYSWAEPIATVAEFQHALSTPITVWRGGGGTYDPSFTRRPWCSFTASEKRTKTFTVYDGTFGKSGMLPRRRGAWWLVELTMPLDDMLLYLEHGQDDEVIVSRKDAARAELKATGEVDPTADYFSL